MPWLFYFDNQGVIILIVTKNQQLESDLSEVMQLVGLLYRRAVRSLEKDETQLSVGTRAVLELLTQSDPQPVPRITEALLWSRQFVQRSVDAGVAAGVLELEDNPRHQRSKLVRPTAAGRDWMAHTIQREQRLMAAGAQHLTADETATCLHVLRTIYDHTPWTTS